MQIDLEKYTAVLKASEELERFNNYPSSGMALALAARIFDAADQAMPPGAAFVINSSTGKDSSVMLQAYFEALDLWQEANRPIRPCVVAIADTASEFPEMGLRMRAEMQAINAYGIKAGIPLTAELVRPPVKHHLLVEILGNGKPLPKLTKSSAAVSSWCMSRVKAGALKQIAMRAQTLHKDFVQTIGVRSSESAKRAGTIGEYSEGLPFGLTMIGFDPGKADMLALMPIVHMDTTHISDIIRSFPPRYRRESREELRGIYLRGKANLEDQTECAVSLSEEGVISNSCSDLGGTRFGCWHCLLSTNKSLANTANNDKRYKWLQKFHRYLFRHHDRNFQRIKRRQKSGFTDVTLFPKTFTFAERYWMLMILLRAEAESGFTLLEADEIAMIETLWRKHGLFIPSVEMARADVAEWRRTGKPIPFFDKVGPMVKQLSQTLGEGLPAGAFFNLELEQQADDGLKQGLDLAHLLFMAGTGIGTPFVPQLLSYVIVDRRDRDRIVVMVTDTPSLPGTKTNTGLINGMQMAAWQCVGVRTPTDWELEMADGRNFFYQVSRKAESEKIAAAGDNVMSVLEVLVRAGDNNWLFRSCDAQEPLAEEWIAWESIGDLKLTNAEFENAQRLSYRVMAASDYLCDHVGHAAKALLREVTSEFNLLETVSPEGSKYRNAFRRRVAETLKLAEHLPVFESYVADVRALVMLMLKGKANPALVLKLGYASQWAPVDPAEEWKLVDRLRDVTQKEVALVG